MDAYTKIVLTVIAGALTVIAYNLALQPSPAEAFLRSGPTWADYLAARRGESSKAPMDVVLNAPLVVACDGPRCLGWSR